MVLGFDRDACLNVEDAMRNEWLETNGVGGYASSTILDCHNRKYHGLLNIPITESNERFVLLHKLDASIALGERTFKLSTNKYPGVFHPTGHKFIEAFTAEYHSTIQWRIGDIRLSRSVMMPKGESSVLICWDYEEGTQPLELSIAPWVAYRSVHDLQHENLGVQAKAFPNEYGITIEPYAGMPALHLRASQKIEWFGGPDWIRQLEYMKEFSRGYEFQEDVFCPGEFEKVLKPGESLIIQASVDAPEKSPKAVWNKELKRRGKVFAQAEDRFAGSALSQAAAKAENFIVQRDKKDISLMGGWPWIGERARDNALAIPGVLAATGQEKEALLALSTWADSAEGPVIAHKRGVNGAFEHQDEADIDATLWWVWSLLKCQELSDKPKKIAKIALPVLESFIAAALNGSLPGGFLRSDGLLSVGQGATAHTWMDGWAYGRPVTPRNGCAVEHNALWFAALNFYLAYAPKKADLRTAVAEAAAAFPAAFREAFWIAEGGYLADVVGEAWRDTAIRPNQLFACVLGERLLSPDQCASIIDVCRHRLLTPVGLRTLSPGHPNYQGMYKGDTDQRDMAQHQGTVSPWLIGVYADAVLDMADEPAAAGEILREHFKPLWEQHLGNHGLFSCSELMNGDPPHKPRGCFAHAPSVGEILRFWQRTQRA